MSSDPAPVMDFLGVGNAERKSQLQLHLERSALHSSLSKIKPQMMQRVLSGRGLLEKPNMDSDSGKKTMGLFPQTTGSGHSQTCAHPHSRNLPYQGHGALLPSPNRKSVPLLTIFYNGAVNVFDVDEGKAQAIMTLAESLNKNPTNTFGEENHATVSSPAAVPRNSTSPQIREDLPIARKHSLQRFLQKRKDRLTSKAPYETSKVTKGGNEEEAAAAECAA